MKCKVCGKEFELLKDNHYISRDKGQAGVFANLVQHDEEKIYDTFDCPFCGCQNVVQDRKRTFVVGVSVGDSNDSIGKITKLADEDVEEKENDDEAILKGADNCYGTFDETSLDCTVMCDNYDACKKISEAGEKECE